MREIANFLKHIYSNSISDIANISVAEHENNKEVLLGYLKAVRDYVDTLINKINRLDECSDLPEIYQR